MQKLTNARNMNSGKSIL